MKWKWLKLIINEKNLPLLATTTLKFKKYTKENEKATEQNKTYRVYIMLKYILMYSLKCGCEREAGFAQNEFAFDVFV